MLLFLNYCIICVEMTRLGELLHSMLFVGGWHLLYSIANAITRRSLLATPKRQRPFVGPICDGGWWRNGRIIKQFFYMDNITKITLDGSHVVELRTSTRPWPRYLVMTATDKGKSLNNLSPFAIHKGVNGFAGGDVTIKRLFNGDIYLTCIKQLRSDNLPKCVMFGNVAPVVTKCIERCYQELRTDSNEIKENIRRIIDVQRIELKGTMWSLNEYCDFNF